MKRFSGSFLPNRVAFTESYAQKAFCGIFSEDGRLFASACQDHTLRLYECRGDALRLRRAARGRDVGWSILDVAFSPDGTQLLYSSWSDYSEWTRPLGAGLGRSMGAGLQP
ncbi:DDB1- and CUL4-associated factor 11 [Apteryx rowi]|uniref:DDB1- and CUL4-associated factor 11 n=1 Tax=Apteryx rowi TaxID=308060 RepID=UPI000E1D97E3|nr:DDB1- and CUL4-associated factor 11 [Apteryx rowi]